MRLRLALTAAVLIVQCSAQVVSLPLPRFEDYPARETFKGPPHAPILSTREQRLYRTRIREGVSKGWGVWTNGEWGKEQGKPGPNFAGRYIVVVWGCGTACIRMVVADAQTGTVHNPPLSDGGLAPPNLVFPQSTGSAAHFDYRKDSRLMIVEATPDWWRQGSQSYTFYFLWENDQWILLRRIPLTGKP